MRNRHALRLVTLACLIGPALLAAPSSPAAEQGTAATWHTNYGKLSLYTGAGGAMTGIYYYKGLPAHLFGVLKDNISAGTWVQGTSEVHCKTKYNGSPFWGRFRFEFSGDRFSGLWNYCERPLIDTAEHRWSGERE